MELVVLLWRLFTTISIAFSLLHAVTLQLSKRVETFLTTMAGVSESQLYHGKLGLSFEETVVLTKRAVVFIAITPINRACAGVG